MPVAKRSRKTLKRRSLKRKRSSSRRRVRKQRGGMRLHVQGPSGAVHALDLDPDAPVGALKPLLEEAEGVPVAEQVLSFGGGAALDDALSLADAGLGEDALLQLARAEAHFVMPIDTTGYRDFGPRIRGPLAAWRAANPNARVANLSGRRDLTDADFVHLHGIRALDLSFCKSANLTNAAFHNVRNLNVLDMTSSSLQSVTDDVFAIFNQLRELSISGCEQFTDVAFSHLPDLEVLEMEDCNQPTITDEGFRSFRRLRVLKMARCNQPGITDATFEHLLSLGTLRTLDTTGCNQEGFTDGMRARLSDNVENYRGDYYF